MTSSPLENLFAQLLGGLGNFGLKLDPLSQVRLDALEGKCVRFLINTPASAAPGALTLCIQQGELNFDTDSEAQPNVVVSGTLADIGALLADPDKDSAVRIDGDETVLAEIASLLSDFEPDLARPMGSIMGREMADGLIGFAEAGIAFLKSAAQSATTSVQQGAQRSYVSEPDFSTLLDTLDNLKLRIDRLSARVDQAESQRAAERGAPG